MDFMSIYTSLWQQTRPQLFFLFFFFLFFFHRTSQQEFKCLIWKKVHKESIHISFLRNHQHFLNSSRDGLRQRSQCTLAMVHVPYKDCVLQLLRKRAPVLAFKFTIFTCFSLHYTTVLLRKQGWWDLKCGNFDIFMSLLLRILRVFSPPISKAVL